MLMPRLLTALVLAPLFIWAVLGLQTEQFQYLLLVLVLLAAWEFTDLAGFKVYLHKVLLLGLVTTCTLVAQPHLGLVLQISVLWWLLNLYWVISYPQHTKLWYWPLAVRLISAPLLLVPMFVALLHLHQHYDGAYFLWLILMIWGADSGAYFVGKTWGKRKLAPRVSPGKSIEGVFGGLAGGLAVTIGFLVYQQIPTGEYAAHLLLSIVVVAVSVLGDLFESLFKRVSNIKDSSNLLPGHGGILDRIDSLTAAAPLFVIGLNLL